MNTVIHGTALVNPLVQLGSECRIGAYVILGAVDFDEKTGPIKVGARCVIGHHSVVFGDVILGDSVVLDPYSRIGPSAKIGSGSRFLYGARVHENVVIGNRCVIAGNCPDHTKIGDEVIHLGKIAHSYYYPFSDWDEPEEPGPTIGSRVVLGTDCLIIGPVQLGNNLFIFPREIVRKNLPSNGVFRYGHWERMPNWSRYLRLLGKFKWAERYGVESV